MFSEEVFQIVKNDVKTTIVCKFNEQGYIVSHLCTSTPIKESDTMKRLKDSLHRALNIDDHEGAIEIQEKINKLRDLENHKPTL